MGTIKLTALFILLSFLQLRMISYSQSTSPPHITLTEKNASLEKILKLIEKQAHYTYFGDVAWLRKARNVTISVKDATVEEVLNQCFKDQPLAFDIVGTNISVRIRLPKEVLVQGKVVNEKGESVPGATILAKASGVMIASDEHGTFRIFVTNLAEGLVVSCINYETKGISLREGVEIVSVQLKEHISELDNVSVVHTGYQDILRERATGSFSKVDQDLINRRVSTNILDRLDGVTSSLLFNKNIVGGTNQSTISIRGRSTILANPDPLLVVDNFPYNGDINNINPDDVETITVLKDAAAASIWGAYSGNGVIVITTKKGKYDQSPTLKFSSSVTAGKRPDLYYSPILNSGDYIDIEQYLFAQLFYSGTEANGRHPALSPVVELLINKRNGQLTPAEVNAQINTLRGQDTRNDLQKYFYRRGMNSQYSLNLSGGGPRNQYYLSAGYDKNLANLVRNEYDRVTVNGNNTYALVPKILELSTALALTSSITRINNSGQIDLVFPYVKLADAGGHALVAPSLLRQSFIDTAGGGQLLDWNYRPLDELQLADNTTRLTDYRIHIGLKYTILEGLIAQAYYQSGRAISDQQNYYSQQTYFVRNLINSYSQPNSGLILRPVPLGGILDGNTSSFTTNNIRLQLNYDHSLGKRQNLTAIAGAELRDMEGRQSISRLYGYDKNLQSSSPVDYTSLFPMWVDEGSLVQIPYLNKNSASSDRYISYYFNASYIYREKYILSASARRDESNIFGVKANQKGVPLWSLGAAWELSREAFYRAEWLPFLKLRLTDGYNGNVDRSVSAYTTATINYPNVYGAITSTIINPPNPYLRWEKINIVNAAVDFATRSNRIEGSLEYYFKSGKDLIGKSPLDPTTGTTQFIGNTADMQSHGIDLSLRTKNTTGAVSWTSVLLFSYNKDKVTNYREKQNAIEYYLSPSSFAPLQGHPLYSVYALRWKGLDPLTGNPVGFLNGHASEEYSSIYNSSEFNNLLYMGPANPPFFGSLRNTFSWKQFGFSFNILYKFGYYFRRNSIDYSALFKGISQGHPDFDKRWQKPGDEKTTNVPSMVYPADLSRDEFYTYSQVLVEKGDHIRLQDIQLSYEFQKKSHFKLPLQSVLLYLYVNNIGILWKANHQGIDPDNVLNFSIPNPRTLAAGIKLVF